MKHNRIFLLALAVLMVFGLLGFSSQGALAATVPTFKIASVVPDSSVSIETAGFPANKAFTVRMGLIGTRGIGGVIAGTLNSGAGGVMKASFNIPAELKGEAMIAIRMDAAGGFFSYNWFFNVASNGNTNGSSKPVPTFVITNVTKDKSVTVKTFNFPASKEFTVRIGKFGTLGVGGTVVAKTSSGSGGTFTATYDIPAALYGSQRLAIRMDADGGFFSYNWFWNNTTGDSSSPSSGYSGIPTFSIQAVVKDSQVTVVTKNLPAGKVFTVRMGVYGTRALNGSVVGTLSSGDGGSLSATYSIPAVLKGDFRIAIRMDASGGFFAYNWFYNNNAP